MNESSPDPVFPSVTMHAVRPNDPVVARVHAEASAHREPLAALSLACGEKFERNSLTKI